MVTHWNEFAAGIVATGIRVFTSGTFQSFFIRLLCEYILNSNTRGMHRPLAEEESRTNVLCLDRPAIHRSMGYPVTASGGTGCVTFYCVDISPFVDELLE